MSPRALVFRTRRALTCLLTCLALAGCAFRAEDLPLPGGPDVGGGDTMTITAEFRDVMDLVPRSSVKVRDVTVGEVERIWLDGFTAKVEMRVGPDLRLPDNATARIRQTSLLGEKFVALAPPGRPGYGRLDDGDVIPLERTGRSVEVEEVLSTLAALLNGGGVAQLKTIEVELNKALEGREDSVKEVLRRLDRVLGELDDHKRDITRAIDSLDRLAADLRRQRTTIAAAVDDIPAALTILADQRRNLTELLTELSELGEVGTRVIEGSKKDLLANLEALDPILTKLAESGDDLPNSLQVLFTYPFADSAADAVRGDYTNLQLTLDADLEELLDGKGPVPLPTGLPKLPLPTSLPTLPVPTSGPRLPLPLPTGLPLPGPSQSSTAEPCLPLLCGLGGSGDAAAADRTTDTRAYDPEVARLLLGGVAR